MDVTFLVGRAGSGKTFKIVNDVTDEIVRASSDLEAPPIFIIVPDQAALSTDLMIMHNLALFNRYATTRLNVCSFNRLINLVLEGSDMVKRPKLTEFGYLLVCQQAMREVKDQLSFYKTPNPNLASEIVKTITELSQYRISPDSLLIAAKNLKSHSLEDLARIYSKFEQINSAQYRGQISDTDYTIDFIRTSSRFKNALVFVDGFATLNQLQEDLLIALCDVAKSVTISICLDPNDIPAVDEAEELDPTRLFAATEKMHHRLFARMPSAKMVCLNEIRRFKSSELLALESAKYNPKTRIGSCKDIELWACTTQRDEIKAVIRDIVRAYSVDKIPFSKMAIAVSNIDAYYQQLSFELQRYQIPFVLDHPTKLGHHPYCRLVSIILRLCSNDFQWFDIIDLVRTELIDLPREDGWILETFISDHHISGTNIWLQNEKWKFDLGLDEDSEEYFVIKHRKRLDKVDTIRQKLLPFLRKIQRLNKIPVFNGSQLKESICEIIESEKIIATIEGWRGDTQSTAVHKTAVDQVLKLFTEIANLSSEDDYRTLSEWQIQVEQALRLIQQRVPPMRTNSVIIGTIEQSRLPELHTIYLMGMDDSGYPRAHIDSQIINSVLRERLRSNGINVGLTHTERQYHENYLSYIATTRAGNKLVITYSKQNKKGEEQQPCALIRFIEQISDSKIVYKAMPNAEFSHTPLHLIDLAEGVVKATITGNVDDYSHYLSVRGQYDYIDSIIQNSRNVPVGGEINREELFPLLVRKNTFETSVSALESYASCPYKYYLRNLLHIPEKSDDLFSAMTLGDLIHKALARMSIKLQNSNIKWHKADISDELMQAFNTEIELFSLLITGAKSNIWQIELLKHNGILILQKFVYFLVKWAAEVGFTPLEFEWQFSKAEPIALDDSTRVTLRGKIDRIDEIDENKVLIVDYKLRARTLDYSKVLAGLSLQLPAYILALSSYKETRYAVAGCLYQNIIPKPDSKTKQEDNKLRKWQQRGVINIDECKDRFDDLPEGYYNIKYTKNGDLNAYSDGVHYSEFELLTSWTRKMIVKICNSILSASFYPIPSPMGKSLSCDYCGQAKSCRFDRLGANPKKSKSMNKRKFFEAVGNVND